jgi:hypothetical protein
MTRHYVGYTARGATTLKNMRSESGFPLLLMEVGEVRKVTLSFASLLESGETISSAAVAGDGVTASSSLSNPNVTLTLSGPSAWGEATITVTLSNGEVIVDTIRVRASTRSYDPAEAAYAL